MNNLWNRPLAALQIIGGVVGIRRTIYYLGEVLPVSILDQLIVGVMLGLYTLTIAAGLLLWRNQAQGIRLSIFMQALQIPFFSLAGLAYRFTAPLGIMTYVAGDGVLNYDFFWSNWRVNLWQHNEPFLLGFNMVALLCFLYLRRQQVGEVVVQQTPVQTYE